MNRIHHLPQPTSAEAFAPFESADAPSRAVESRQGSSALFAPLHYEQNYAYPLLVWLHGPGDDEGQLRRIMPLLSMRNYVAVAPRGVCARPRADGGRAGYDWAQRDQDILNAEQCVFDAIDAARAKYHIAERRVFIAGFDTGGTMAFRIAVGRPRRFAGVLSLGGGFPARRNPLAQLHDVRRIPLFLASGRDSDKYPADRVCHDLRLLHTAGISVCLRQYPCGQEIAPAMLADMDRWMMEQITDAATH